MEAGLADFVVGRLGDILVQQIVNETALVFNFTKDLQWLQRKLPILRSPLQHADGQSTQDESVKQWIHRVRDIVLDAEDIFEEYGVESLYSDITSTQTCGCSYRQLLYRYKMGRRIREIKDRVRLVIEDAWEMKILHDTPTLQQAAASASSSTSQTDVWRRSSVLERDARPMAVDDKVKEIVSLLKEPDHSVIAVVGMGGVGKTFLMQNVLKKVHHIFEKSVWLSISQIYSVPQLQCDLAFHLVSYLKDLKRVGQSGRSCLEVSQLDSQIEGLERIAQSGISCLEAASLIYSCLEGKNILIVLDDVWKSFQDLIRRLGLPCSCKIVVTTRNKQIINNMNNVCMYKVRPLPQEHSWNLFCVYAFSDCPQNRPPDCLEELSHKIERECAGLPLAIKTVATSVANNRNPSDWESKLRQLIKVKSVDPEDPIMQIIKLSFDLLPASLKSCFAYLSFFPEDHEIECEYLIHLWAAEGFIHVKDDEDELKIGWDYINRLANLCLIELEGSERFKRCKVHDLVLDFAVRVSRDNKCAFAVEEAFTKGKSACRRILLAKKIEDNDFAERNLPSLGCVRTLTLFNNSIGDNVSANLFSHLRVLRVLDMSRTGISTLPEFVGNLKLLRVLNLSRTKIEQVPECVRKLKSLRFLDISGNGGRVALPAWIGELTRLQHLNIYDISQTTTNNPPKGISKLLSLQTLSSSNLKLPIEDNETESLKLEDLAILTKLRELSIEINHEEQRKRLEEGILAGLVNMRHLDIWNRGQQMANLPETMKAMKDLVTLELVMFSVPACISAFANLRYLLLSSCECSDYSALALERMPREI